MYFLASPTWGTDSMIQSQHIPVLLHVHVSGFHLPLFGLRLKAWVRGVGFISALWPWLHPRTLIIYCSKSCRVNFSCNINYVTGNNALQWCRRDKEQKKINLMQVLRMMILKRQLYFLQILRTFIPVLMSPWCPSWRPRPEFHEASVSR